MTPALSTAAELVSLLGGLVVLVLLGRTLFGRKDES